MNTMAVYPRKYNRIHKQKAAPTLRQLASREKLRLAMHFLHPLRGLTGMSWHAGAGTRQPEGFHGALGHLITQAIGGEYPSLYISYSQVKLSRGKLAAPAGMEVAAGEGALAISWDPSVSPGSAEDDRVVVLLYNEDKAVFLVRGEGAWRKSGMAEAGYPAEFIGDRLHVWLFFVSRSGRQSSASVYSGPVQG